MDSVERRYDFDWVRLIGMASVFTFHIMMYFNTWPWHAKNVATTAAVQPLNSALLIWIMPIFFTISGFGARQALRHRSAGGFARERLLRLGVPVLTGAFLLSPFQVYSERVTYGQFSGSFISFLPHYFQGWYSITPGGNFAWHGLHLWFLLVLLPISLVTLPLFAGIAAKPRLNAIGRAFRATGPTGALLLIPILIWILEGLLSALGLTAGQSGWPYGAYLGFYAVGFFVLPGDQFRAAVHRYGAIALPGLLLATGLVTFVREPASFSPTFIAWHLVRVYSCWLWIVGLCFLADRYLNRNSPALQYGNEAVMPFYVLHQPVIVGLGFAIRAMPISIPVKLALLFVCALAITLGLYHFVVRPVNVLRFLVGMRLRRPSVEA